MAKTTSWPALKNSVMIDFVTPGPSSVNSWKDFGDGWLDFWDIRYLKNTSTGSVRDQNS
jgi:hypothetical protein